MTEDSKRLYDEAAQSHKQAKDILTEFAGKELPPEKQVEVDHLLDEVEAKTGQAKTLEAQEKQRERLTAQDALLNDPVTRKQFFAQKTEVQVNGQALSEDELAEMKAIAPFKAFHAPTSPDYAAAFKKYLRCGAGGLNNEELKALSVGDPQAGGIWCKTLT